MRVVICGAGIAGLTTALFLKRAGHEPILIERAPGLRGEGYMIDFIGSGIDACERAGLMPAIEKIHRPIDRLVVVDEEGNDRFGIDYPELRERVFRGRHYNFLRGDLERVLFDALEGRVEIRFGRTVMNARNTAGEVVVLLDDGAVLHADVLVGADGLRSEVRRLAFGEGAGFWRSLGLHTAAFTLDTTPPEIGRHDFSTLTVPGRQVSVYPIEDGRIATFFLHHADAPAPRKRSDRLGELRDVYAGLGWVVPQLLAAADSATDLYFDDVAQIELPTWNESRIVLVGDACSCVSLIAGQGASLAMAEGYVLARELTATPDDILGALRRYGAALRPGVARKQRAGRKTAGWFLPNGRAKLAVRDLALRMSMTRVGAWLMRRQISGDSLIADR